jgi:hypothetical protein
MPELDFMLVADYVRAESGVLHMIAAGFDTLYTPAVPSTRQIGIGLRLLLSVAETRHEHPIELLFQDPDGRRLAQLNAMIPAQPIPPNAQPGRPFGVVIPFNIQLPLPAYGDFSFELLIHGNHVKSIPIIIVPPPEATLGGTMLGLPGNA